MKKRVTYFILSLILVFCFEAKSQVLLLHISSEKKIFKIGEPIYVNLKVTSNKGTKEKIQIVPPASLILESNIKQPPKFNLIFKVYNEKGENVYPFGGSGVDQYYPDLPASIPLNPHESYKHKFLIAYHWPPEKNQKENSKGIWTLMDKAKLQKIYPSLQDKIPWITSQRPGKYHIIAFYNAKLKDLSIPPRKPFWVISNELTIEIVE